MAGIIGKKIGMTSFFDEDGKSIPCTIIEAGPCYVTQVKNNKTDGYEAVQLGFGEKKESRSNKAELGHFKKAKSGPLSKLAEFRDFGQDLNLGDEIKVDLFETGDLVEVIGNSKGKGFQGVVKRHGFSGVGGQTHGQHNRERAPGSIGAASDPSRVFKGMKMAGRTGNSRTKEFNLAVVKVDAERNLLFVKGAVPGHKGTYLIIEK